MQGRASKVGGNGFSHDRCRTACNPKVESKKEAALRMLEAARFALLLPIVRALLGN